MNIEEFLNDYGSTTAHFKSWSNDYHLDILDHGICGNKFHRVVLIWVDKIPVMIGLSETELTNLTFVEILQNAGAIPIGVRLFAPNSGITRTEASISQIGTDNIINKSVRNYLTHSNTYGSIYLRQSNFVTTNEKMMLKEYILPGLIELLEVKTS